LTRGFGLDLVRAIAIVFVLVAHDASFLGYWFNFPVPFKVSLAGMFGVELFFVLSGLLIGRLLLDLVEYGPNLRNLGIFLARRWMRTLPLYFLWLAFLLLCRPPAGPFGWHVLHYVTLTQNLLSGMPEGEFFPVTWSLTIEEWFYLLFATSAVACVAVLRRPAAIWLVILLFLVVPPFLRWQVPDSADFVGAIQKVAVLRLDAIAFGVLMAAILRRWTPPLGLSLHLLASGVTILCIVWANRVAWPAHVFRSFIYTLVPVGGMLCLPAAAAWGRCDGWYAVPVRWLSRYSYGLYIMHFTVLEIASAWRVALTPWGAALVGICGPFVVAGLSWHFLEAPILARRPEQIRDHAPGGTRRNSFRPTEPT